MSEFKVGDKVCDPVLGLNGVVINDNCDGNYVIKVHFDEASDENYTADGRLLVEHGNPSLFHGHMEPGTGKVTFQPKKEPVYEWQWLIRNTNQNSFFTSAHHEDIEGIYKPEYVLCRIEESRREVKS